MRISVVVAMPDVQEVTDLELSEGSCVAQALEAAAVAARHPGLDLACCGIWGRRCRPDTVLRAGDRVEVYRPLCADAKAMRRARVTRRR